MGSIYDWSTTAASNGSADATVNFAEGQSPSTVNDAARALMARVAAWVDTLGGAATYGGSSNAYTITSPSGHAITAYADGMLYTLQANHTNSGAATVNIDTLGAKTIKTADGGDVASGDLVSGGLYLLAYDGVNFQVMNTVGGGSYQPLDADLTAIAALGYTSGAYVIKKTAADTWALVDEASYAHLAGTETFTGAKTFTSSLVSQKGDGSWLLQGNHSTGPANVGGIWIDTSTVLRFVNATFNAGVELSPNTINLNATTVTKSGNIVYHAGNLPGTAITWAASSAQRFTADGGAFAVDILGRSADNIGLFRFLSNSAATEYARFDSRSTHFAFAVGSGATEAWRATTALVTFALPVVARAASSTETTGTLTSASANKSIIATGGITLPNAVFTAGDTILIDGGGTARTITRGASVTMYKAGTDSATATLAANGLMTVFWRTASVCVLGGDIS